MKDPVDYDEARYQADLARGEAATEAFEALSDTEKLEGFFFEGTMKEDEYRAGFLVEFLLSSKKPDALTDERGCLPTKKSDILWLAIRESSDLQQEWVSYREKWIREYLEEGR